LLACNFLFLAMVARREAVVMHWRPMLAGFCLQGMGLLDKSSFERKTRCPPAAP
jgi:hypothetical protein